MRITSSQMYDNLMSGIQKQLDIQAKGNAQISSGTRFQKPADAGLDYKTSLDLRHMQNGVKGGLEAIDVADMRLGASQTALNDMRNVLVRAQTLAVQLGSAQNSAAERLAGSQEVKHLMNQLLSDANTRWQGESLFSGTSVNGDAFSTAASAGITSHIAGANTSIVVTQTSNTNAVNDTYTLTLNALGTQIDSITDAAGVNQLATPVVLAGGANALNLSNGTVLSASYTAPAQTSTSGGVVTVRQANIAGNMGYLGSDQDRIVSVSNKQQIVSNIRGDNPTFSAAYKALSDLNTALTNNDAPATLTALGALNTSGDDVIALTSDVGSRIHAVSLVKDAQTDLKFNLDRRLNEHEGIDIAAVMTQLQQSSISLQAAYSQISSVKSLSLINFLR